MKRIVGVLFALALTVSTFAAYNIGDVCDNISWTDNNGLSTSIYDQVDQGNAVMLFFGQSW